MEKFSYATNGYNCEEVNQFISDVIVQTENIVARCKEQRREIEELKKELEHYKNIERTLNRALIIAEESSNNIKKVAYDESKVIIEDAKKNASRIINNALIKAEKIDSEAMNLKNQVIRYKKRYKNLLEEQLDEVEKLDIEH